MNVERWKNGDLIVFISGDQVVGHGVVRTDGLFISKSSKIYGQLRQFCETQNAKTETKPALQVETDADRPRP